MKGVTIAENNKSSEEINTGGFGLSKISKHSQSPLTTLHEERQEHFTSHGTLLNTVEAMQVNMDDFNEHIETCNVDFKRQIMEKAKSLKRTDTQVLTERVEELKG
jgi:phosphoenolpyruvate-protein kinase (PTS system EI component)